MLDNALVSVILPTYNRAKLLPRSIDSVLNQTYQNWELLVWDDGSTDNTVDIVSGFSDQRVHYFFAENSGVAAARNQAISNAKGMYLAFLDSDDEWHHEKLSIQMLALQTNPTVDLLFSNFKNINHEKNRTALNFKDYREAFGLLTYRELGAGLQLIEAGFNESLTRGNYIATDTVLLKSDILVKHGLFNESLRNSEDFELWWRLGLSKIQMAFHDQVLMTRHKPEGSLTSLNLSSASAALEALDLCKEHAIFAGRKNLVDFLRQPYRNAWQNMITARALEGDRIGAFKAFHQSLKYGFRLGSLRLLLQAFFCN